jgi:hypothetical protein
VCARVREKFSKLKDILKDFEVHEVEDVVEESPGSVPVNNYG